MGILSSHCGAPTDAWPISDIVRLDGDNLPLSRLIELAGAVGFTARYVYGDWRWLQMELSFHPSLLILKNTNVVVAIANGRIGIEEIVVRDPLHHDAETIILSREDLERAWDGDLLIITPHVARPEKSPTECDRGSSVIILQPEASGVSDTGCDREDHSRKWSSVQSEPREKALKSVGHRFSRMNLGLRFTGPLCVGLITLLAALLFAPLTNTSDKWTAESARQQPSPTGAPVAYLELNRAKPTALAYAAVEETTEGPSSAGATLPPETSTKSLLAVAADQTNPGSITAPAERRPTTPPMPQETLPEKPSVAEAQPTNPGSTFAALNQRLLDRTPPPEIAAKALPAAGAGPTGAGSTAARPSEADPAWLSTDQTLTEAESAALVARGDDYLRMGDVASARLFYEHVADAGWANAALRLGETFDPIFLDHAQMRGIAGDMQKAIFWYRRARDLGSTEARTLLAQFDAN